MTEPNPYAASPDDLEDVATPVGRTRWYHFILTACIFLAIPFYVFVALASAWEVVHARGRSQVAFAIWFVLSLGSAFLCRFAYRQMAAVKPYSVLYAVLGLSGVVIVFTGSPLVYKLAELIHVW